MMEDFLIRLKDIASTYGTDTIFILGKGPSADDVPSEVYAGSLVIGLNDAERIYPTDISIFHADWVKQALESQGPRARLYLTSSEFSPVSGYVVRLPHAHLGQESSDLMFQRLLANQLVIEDILFMTALQVARIVARERGRKQTVYMVGFDFRADLGSAHALGRSYETDAADLRRLRIDMQENFLLNALYMLRDTNVDLRHVGDRPYSRINSSELLTEFLPGRERGRRDWQVSVVAELTTNHFGDRGRLERMVRACKAAGANFVKVQKRDVDTFYTSEQLEAPYRSPFGTTFREYRRQLELSEEDFDFLSMLCKSLEIGWFASALDEPSYHTLVEAGSAMIKLPSTISEHTNYLASVASTCDRPIVLSTGMTNQAYEKWVLETFAQNPELYLLQCNSAYPTPSEDCNVGVVRHYDRLSHRDSRIIPGYSSHDEGWFGSALAVAAGARMVEKHVKLGNTEWAHFDAVALDLTTSAFKDYVSKIREAEIVVGSELKEVQASEHHKYWRQ